MMTEFKRIQIPVVPLHTVLLPEGPLPLRIFEPRYLDMISKCMKEDSAFGICLIAEGDEVGSTANPHEIGTIARIKDWNMGRDGILGITVVGEQRFKIISSTVKPNNLMLAEVELLPERKGILLKEEYTNIMKFVKESLSNYSDLYSGLPERYDDALWVSYRLTEMLPLKLYQKQYFLQLDDPEQRLERLTDVLDHLDIHV
ncbi:MAG: LON peptidase substrate-binding domain-containing protein [Gammaproteobacteria bacterium]|nr:LON peptidase substrate-binding domain-containing protein [Gammaproteobacteria bacterium]